MEEKRRTGLGVKLRCIQVPALPLISFDLEQIPPIYHSTELGGGHKPINFIYPAGAQ